MKELLCPAALLLVFQFLFPLCDAYSSGAPDGRNLCETMTPRHKGSAPQTISPPYVIIASPGNDGVLVTIEAKDNKNFKGFLLQAETENGEKIPGATYSVTQKDTHKILQCDDKNSVALTHTSNDLKTKHVTKWIPPANFARPVKFVATVVKEYSEFWLGIESQLVNPPTLIGARETAPPLRTTSQPLPLTGERQQMLSDCGVNRGCFGYPSDCVQAKNCDSLVSYVTNGDVVTFKIATSIGTSTTGYAAIAFSTDVHMGDDFVTECILRDGQQPTVEQSWNFGRTNEPLQQVIGLRSRVGRITNGELICEWEQEQNFTAQNRNFSLAVPQYHLFIAKGPVETGVKRRHRDKLATSETIDFNSFSIAGASKNYLVKIHGSLMVGAWIGTVSIGILLARHYKQVWEAQTLCATKVWFACHRSLMVLSVIMTVAAFIIIFVSVDGWSSENNPHPILGIITTILAIAQPIMAIFRPHPTAPKRPIFNWMHWLVGNGAHIIAITTIFFAMELQAIELPTGFLWILVAFVAFHCLVHFLMQVHAWLMEKKRNNEISMKDFTARESAQDTPKDAPGSGFRRFILGIYIVVNICLVAALVLIICLS